MIEKLYRKHSQSNKENNDRLNIRSLWIFDKHYSGRISTAVNCVKWPYTYIVLYCHGDRIDRPEHSLHHRCPSGRNWIKY